MKSFLIVGLGRFGASLAQELCEQGHEVLAVFSSKNNTAIGAQLKEALLDSYLKGVNNTNIA